MPVTVDGIILGSGHNSLVLQAYLSRAGLQTICLECNSSYGGGLATVEYPAGSGFLHNTHSFYHRGLQGLPWYHDLQLQEHGAHYLEPELNVALITPSGQTLQWWNHFEKTEKSFAAFSRRDAETLRAWRDEFRPILNQLLIPESQSPPLPEEQRQTELKRSSLGRRLLEVSQLTPLEFVQQNFEHPTVQAGLLFFNGLREVDLRCAGFGHHIPALLASDRLAQMCRGGSVKLADSLAAVIEQNGGTIRCSCQIRSILVEGDRVVGVALDDGEQIHARKFIASGLNPQQTFLDLIDASHLPAAWRAKARNYQYNLVSPLFSLNLNLSSPPRYSASRTDPELDQAFMVILGLDHFEQFEQIVSHHERGTIPPTVMWGSCATQFDSSQAPAGAHTAFMWEKLPYAISGDPQQWDALKTAHGNQMLDVWDRYAPGLKGQVLDRFTRSPLDTERSLTNMVGGDLLVGALADNQIGFHRPFPGAGHYRGHLSGLYLCGSSSHPGGNITGLPGYNCAQVLSADLGLGGNWQPSPLLQQWPTN
jgi:phytoene dehydrogenase-like protein